MHRQCWTSNDTGTETQAASAKSQANNQSNPSNGEGQSPGGGTNWAGGGRAFVKAECLDETSTDSASSSTPYSPLTDAPADVDSTGGQASAVEPEDGVAQCNWTNMNEPADSLRWESNSPASGTIEGLFCGAPADDGTGLGGVVAFRFAPFTQPGAPAVPPPPTATQVAQIAVGEILIPQPKVSIGPDRTKLAVNLWTWVWIDDPGAQTATAALGGVSVTATATLTSVTWSLGEPAATGGPYESGPPVTLTCQGTGSAPPANYDWKAQPPCGHKYAWMSAKDRTAGGGKWPITATSNWNVTWQSNTGVSGSTVLNASSTDALEIGEYRTVLVQGPGG